MWKSRASKKNEKLAQSVCGVSIKVEINLSSLNEPPCLNELDKKWLSLNCVTRSFNIQVIKGLPERILIISPDNNELTDSFNISLPMWVDNKSSTDSIELIEDQHMGSVYIIANGNPVGFYKIIDLIEVINGSPNLDRSNALACYKGIELQPTSEWVESINGGCEIPYKVTAYGYGINYINSVTKVSMRAIK